MANNTVIDSPNSNLNDQVYVYSGGVANGATLNGGELQLNGGVASGTVINNSATE